MRRAQIAIFIVLILVVVGTFLILIIISQNRKAELLRNEQISKGALENRVKNIETNIQSCFKLTAEETLEVAGRQAGFILDYQGGSADSKTIVRNEPPVRVFWILRDTSDQPPKYPKNPSFIGKVQIPVLEGSGKKYPSISEMMRKYFLYRFVQCVNLSQYSDINLRAESPSLEITLGEESTTFHLIYPSQAEVGREKMKVGTTEYKYVSNVRFKKMYESAVALSYSDMNQDFPMLEDLINSNGKYNKLYPEGGFAIKRGISYDTVILFDKKTGYNFTFLRQNRNPILKKLPDPLEFNISEEINLEGYAQDPDEDPVNISVEIRKLTPTGDVFVRKSQGVFKMDSSDIGEYFFNVSVIDPEGLMDWQRVIVRIKCEYESGVSKTGNKWTSGGRTFEYNPLCCNETDRLSFKKGIQVALSDGSTCTCNEYGECN